VSSAGDEGLVVVVGRIGRAHGVRGEVSVEPLTDEPQRRFATGAVLGTRSSRAGTRWPELTVTASRTHRGRLLVDFEEIADRAGAESARGTELTVVVTAAERPEDPEEFYDHQLVGLPVHTTTGAAVGELVRVEHNGAQDLLVIATAGGEVLFPFVSVLVPEVDLDAGRIVVDDVPGLLAEP
jgi:16S rRNA processing protein RimM